MLGYDYFQSGAYFVTVCTNEREGLFGDIVNMEMVLNDAGRMIETVAKELPDFYPGVSLDTFQIMPNHIHGIIIYTRSIVGAGPCACPGVL